MDVPESDLAPRRLPAMRWLGDLGALVLGGVFLVAAWGKAIDPVRFVEQIRAEGLEGILPAEWMSYIALALEAGLGVALLLLLRRPLVLLPATLLVGFFVFLVSRSYHAHLTGEGGAHNCGCFGNLADHTPEEAFWRDILLLVPPLVLAWLWRRRPAGALGGRALVAALFGVGAVVLGLLAPGLPLDELATRMAKGDRLEGLCSRAGGDEKCFFDLIPSLAGDGLGESGRAVLVFMYVNAEGYDAHRDALNDALDADPGLIVHVMTPIPDDGAPPPADMLASFDTHPAPLTFARPLYRRLPRSLLVVDGVIVETADGLPPFADWRTP